MATVAVKTKPYSLKEVAEALEKEGIDLKFLAQLIKKSATQTIQITKALTEPLTNPVTGAIEYMLDPVTGKQVPKQKIRYEIGRDGRERPITIAEEHLNPKAIKDVMEFMDKLIETPPKEVRHELGLSEETRRQIDAASKVLEDNPELARQIEERLSSNLIEANYEVVK